MKNLILLVGETGSGKDTVARKLPYKKVISYTTRPMRDADINGVNHWFISDKEMDELEKKDLIAWTKTGEVRYCATVGSLIEDTMIYIINPNGVRWFKEHYKGDEINVITIGIYVPLEERKRRCKDRSDFNSSFIKRVKDEQKDFDNFRLNGEFDYLIKNTDSNITAQIIKNIIDTNLSVRNKKTKDSGFTVRCKKCHSYNVDVKRDYNYDSKDNLKIVNHYYCCNDCGQIGDISLLLL